MLGDKKNIAMQERKNVVNPKKKNGKIKKFKGLSQNSV